MKQLPLILFTLMIITCSALVGAWFGQNALMQNEYTHGNNSYMHSVLHDQLNVTNAQDKKLANIEKEFKRLKMLYQGQIKMANMELAKAIEDGGYESPEIENIIHKIHGSMGKLQALSLKHLTQMQSILNEEQKAILKELVAEQLYENDRK